MKSNEQKLVDLVFAVANLTKHDERVQKMDRETHMAWVSATLKRAGFYTVPMGMSWGVLTAPPPEERGKPTIEIVEADRDDF
jgi:hypothetical protein